MNEERLNEIKQVLENEFKGRTEEEILASHYSQYIGCGECPLQINGYCKKYGNDLGCDELILKYIHEV